MAEPQARVVVQLANGDALEQNRNSSDGVMEKANIDASESYDAPGQLGSPTGGNLPSAPMIEEKDAPLDEEENGEEQNRIHPPSSPSPPPSMTPPDHQHLHQSAPVQVSYATGNYTVRSSPSRPTGIRTVVASTPNTSGTTTVVLATSSPSSTPMGSLSAAVAGGPAVVVATPAGQSPGQAAVQSDHCYGLPYQDHNYGGPAIIPGAGQVSTPGGRPPYPFKVRYPAGYRALQVRDRTATLSNSEGDAPENFPVIGGLERYLNDEATEPETSPAPSATTTTLARNVAGDTIAISNYRGGGGGGAGSSGSTGSQYSNASGSVPYYQRYISPVDYANQSSSPAYSQHLVQIGDPVLSGRTYIRQTTGPPPAAAGVGNGPLFRNRQDYIGINNPPVLIPPYGGRGRGGQKRAGRPRLSRNASGSVGTYSSSSVSGGGGVGGSPSGQGPASYTSSIIPGTETGHAPMIAPSKGGRPPGRGRGGARRRSGFAAANSHASNASSDSPLPPIKSPDEEKQEKDALAGLLIDYEKRYDELLNRPLAGVSNSSGTPRGGRGRGRGQRLGNPPRKSANHVGSPEMKSETLSPAYKVEENGYVEERTRNDSLEVGPMTALLEQVEDHPPPPPRSDKETSPPPQSDSDTEPEEETTSTDTDTEGEWAGTDYVTRCLCGMQHNDEFMISCDKCDVWQHCRCMGIDTRKIPDNYLCEKCNPRPLKLSAEKAKEFQAKKLEKKAKEKERRRQQRERRREQKRRAKERRRSETKENSEMVLPKQKAMDTYHEVHENDYTDEAKKFVQIHGDTLGYNLLEKISENVCQSMYVAPGKWGLVTARTVPPNQPVAEYRGRICLKSECSGRDKLGRVMTYTLMYSGFPMISGQLDAFGGQDTICADARLKGSPARFVRRSCRPNTQVKHVIKAGQLHLLLVSTELIERGTEVTIPYDFDFRSSKYPVDCACATLPLGSPLKEGVHSPGAGHGDPDENPCPIHEHNRNLEASRKEGTGRNKRASITVAQPAERKKPAPKRADKRGKKQLKIKMQVRAKNAVKKAKGNYKRAAAPKRRPVPRRRPEERSETETNELKALKQDFWSSSEQEVSPAGRKRGFSDRSPSSDDHHKPLSREERKLQGLVHQIQKMEEAAKKKVVKSPEKKSPKGRTPVAPVGRKRRSGRWKKGQEKGSRKAKAKKKDEKEQSDDQETDSDLKSDSEDDEDGSAGGASGGGGSGPTTRNSGHNNATGGNRSTPNNLRGPPRKRWTSSTGNQDAVPIPTESTPVGRSGIGTPPSGGTKKRWLRQAMSEDQFADTGAPPPEKRTRNESSEREDFHTTHTHTLGIDEPGSIISRAEAADVLSQMSQPIGAPDVSQSSVIPSIPAESVRIPTRLTTNDPNSHFQSPPVLPAPVKKRKKVSLDEYKKRKGVPPPPAHEKAAAPLSAPVSGAPNFGATAQSFIPQMSESDILASGRSFKLGNLPDPEKLGRGTATIEDLKQRIYGRNFAEGQNQNVNPGVVEVPPPEKLSPTAAPPPPPPPEKPKPSNRMSLADRLRTEFGLEPEPEPTNPPNPFAAGLYPPEQAFQHQPPPPPGGFQRPPPPPPPPLNGGAEWDSEEGLCPGKRVGERGDSEEEGGKKSEEGEISSSDTEEWSPGERRKRSAPPRRPDRFRSTNYRR